MAKTDEDAEAPVIGRREALYSISGVAGATTLGIGVSTAAPSVRSIERAIHKEVNERRANNGLRALSYNEALAADARAHSKRMATEGFFSHTAPGESSFTDHYSSNCSALAENILYRSLRADTATAIAENVVNQWMRSPGHRANILGDFASEGIGVYITSNNVLYATQALGAGCSAQSPDDTTTSEEGSDDSSREETTTQTPTETTTEVQETTTETTQRRTSRNTNSNTRSWRWLLPW